MRLLSNLRVKLNRVFRKKAVRRPEPGFTQEASSCAGDVTRGRATRPTPAPARSAPVSEALRERSNEERPTPLAPGDRDPNGAVWDGPEPTESTGSNRADAKSLADELSRLLSRFADGARNKSFELVEGDAAAAPSSTGCTPSGNGHHRNRIPVRLPACAVGHCKQEGEWTEMTCTIELGRKGTTICLRRRVDAGSILRLTLQLPNDLEGANYSAPNYSIYGVVRRTEPSGDGVKVELDFIGEKPPEGYPGWPNTAWAGRDRRRKARERSWDVIWVEYLDDTMQCVTKEMTRTEDLSAGGIRVIAKSPPPAFELVRVTYPNRAFETYAAVRNRYVGRDGRERLCLRFLDHDWYPGPSEMSETPRTDAREPEAKLRPKKILVADDDPPFRRVLGKVLSQAGYQVVLAEDGKMAVEKTKTEKPDLVITDVLMPKMHGFLVCKAIKEMEAAPKVIMLTGVYTKPSYKWEAKDHYGADDMIPKPFVVADLLARIEHQLSR